MVVTIVKVEVKLSDINDFIAATELNYLGTIKEPGNIRFDLIQHEEDATKFVLYEAFKKKEDILKHKEADHYLQWRKSVDNMMAVPRSATVYTGLFL